MPALGLEGKVLITGASGFIGGRLLGMLADEGSNIVTIRRVGSPEPAGVRSVEVDYADVAGLQAAIDQEKPDYVFHVAGVTKGRTYEDFAHGNVVPTQNLLAALDGAHRWVKRFVLLSSLGAYGPSDPARPTRESDPQNPIEHYGQSKLEAEKAVEESGLPWSMARPGGVYGPGDVDYFNLFQSAMIGINTFFGNRDRQMSLIYVDDLVRALVRMAQHPACVGKGYFLETEESVSWEALQERILHVVGAKDPRTADLPEGFVSLAAWGGELASCIDGRPRLLNRQKVKMGAQNAWTCTAQAARADFGFRGEVDLEEGLRRTHAWYAEHGWYRENRLTSGLLRGLLRGFPGRSRELSE